MGKNDIYTIKAIGTNGYEIAKFDKTDMEFLGSYAMSEIIGGDGPGRDTIICTCPANARMQCRHQKMLRLFQAEDRVSKGWFYHYDKKEWIEPVKQTNVEPEEG